MDVPTKQLVIELDEQDYAVLFGFADMFNDSPQELASRILAYNLSSAYRIAKVVIQGVEVAREI